MTSCLSALWKLFVSLVQLILVLAVIAWLSLTLPPWIEEHQPEIAQVISEIQKELEKQLNGAPPPQVAEKPAPPDVADPPEAPEPVNYPVRYQGPELPDYHGDPYRQVDGNEVVQTAVTVGQLANLLELLGGPKLWIGVSDLAEPLLCYQQHNVLKWRAYHHNAEPLNYGVVVVADYARFMDGALAAECIFRIPTPTPIPGTGTQTLELTQRGCGGYYFLPDRNNPERTYAIAYAATHSTTCDAFCNALEGCKGNPDVRTYNHMAK